MEEGKNYKLVIVSNFFNHHQLELSESFYEILKDDFLFVEVEKIPEKFIKTGYPNLSFKKYIYKLHEKGNIDEFIKIVNSAEIVIFGSAPEEYFKQRMMNNLSTFRYSERWFKKDFRSLFSPRFWLHLIKNHYPYINKNVYMLCASSFTKYDTNLLYLYQNKCYKWGYFPSLDNKEKKLETANSIDKKNMQQIKIVWVGRFIDWKHPELAIYALKRIIDKGYNVMLEMIGAGVMLDDMKLLSLKLNLEKYIIFRGNIENNKVNEALERADIFIFTSDRNEGWGAVLNEAMANSCAVITSNEIGASNFLVEDGVNGLIFTSKSIDSLQEKIELLIQNEKLRCDLGTRANATISNEWNGRIAAQNFLKLYENMKEGKQNTFEKGPCSKA